MSTPRNDPLAPRSATPSAVLDTQVVLDWLVFRDPGVAPLAEAVESGAIRWLASAAMRAEFEHVLDRGVGAAWHPDRAVIANTWGRHARPAEPGPLPAQGLHCTDRDDQMFIDLALTTRANWLVSRDKALLRLARRARPGGLIVLSPVDWHVDIAAAG
jgi:predicted nucleic acid-binding protein